jgi:hypothetical protein
MQVANLFQFDQTPSNRSPLCLACEEMLADAIDQTLSPDDKAWFDRHTATCADCSTMVSDAQRGAAWLEMLKSPRPEPSAHLVERIIAQTSGAEHAFDSILIGQPAALPIAAPAPQRGNLLQLVPRFKGWANPNFEPRLALTAAMAFFSIALTLNLAGVRLDQFHAADLRPSNLKRTFYEANAASVRYYDNLRVVRVMESRVDSLRDANSGSGDGPDDSFATEPEAQPQQAAPAPDSQPVKKSEPKNPGPTSHRDAPLDRPRFLNTDFGSRRTLAHTGGVV